MYLQIHQHFSHCVLLAVLFGLTMDVTSGMGSIQPIPQYPVINGSVILSVTGITGILEYANWFKGPSTDSQYQILVYYPGSSSPLVTGRLYNPRFSVFNNGSLQIKDLLTTDGGKYTVKTQTDKGPEDIAVSLAIYEPVAKPKITASTTQPKENDTFTLTCEVSHATTITTWTRSGTSISSQAKLSGENKTVTFSSIKRKDSGQYQCEAQNIVSKESSDPYSVTVAYGPDNVKIEGTSFLNPGSPITLTCSADSFPTPKYQWKVNGTVLGEKTDKYGISNAMHENEGTYTCTVTNTVTGRTAAASLYVNVTTDYIEPPPQTSKELAMIIGIVVAVLLLLLLIAAISYLFIIHKRRKNSNDSNSNMKASSRNGQADIPTQSGEQHELQYASIEFSKNMPKKEQNPEAIYENRTPQAAPPPTENVVYSELKLR